MADSRAVSRPSIFDSGEFGGETPICSLKFFMRQYVREWDGLHRELMVKLGLNDVEPVNVSDASTTKDLFTQVRRGLRKLDWCPAGLRMNAHIIPYLERSGLRVVTLDDETMGLLLQAHTRVNAWLLSSSESGIDFRNVPESGMFDRLTMPDVTQMAFIVAAAVFRHKKLSFSSGPQGAMAFARTSLRCEDGSLVGLAHEPGRAIYFRRFPPDYSAPDLVIGASVLP